MATNDAYQTPDARERDEMLEAIARQEMPHIETLRTRGNDTLDIHEVSARALLVALRRAYGAGELRGVQEGEALAEHRYRLAKAPPTRCQCPACGRDIEIRPLT